MQEVTIGNAYAMEEAPEWEVLEMAVDSGASVTVIGRNMVNAVSASGPKPDIKYEVADGSYIENLGEKSFTAFTDVRHEHFLTAQVTDVNKALLSVSKLGSKGCKVVFDGVDSYIENKATGDWFPLEEKNGMYVLKLWVPKEQGRPF